MYSSTHLCDRPTSTSPRILRNERVVNVRSPQRGVFRIVQLWLCTATPISSSNIPNVFCSCNKLRSAETIVLCDGLSAAVSGISIRRAQIRRKSYSLHVGLYARRRKTHLLSYLVLTRGLVAVQYALVLWRCGGGGKAWSHGGARAGPRPIRAF